MNVFEDLIVQLKQEKLLEQTIMDLDEQRNAIGLELEGVDGQPVGDEYPHDEFVLNDVSRVDKGRDDGESNISKIVIEEVSSSDAPLIARDPLLLSQKPTSGQDFYRKRAVDEVSNLQMVEHVLTGVEREYMKVAPNVFDDFNAKKALNVFLHIVDDENSTDHQEAEHRLMRETEAWCTHIAKRDQSVPVSSLRQYCEKSRPALSSRALIALARFYRNLPHSESVRAKFDFVITRLFSRPAGNEGRVCLFTHKEILNHINTLYREWSSIALYTADEDESKVLLTALSFEDLAIEAESAGTFDQLIERDFFGRVRNFKSSISELFYAPHVTAAAIDANVRIGNAYVRLIDRERQRSDPDSIQSKYGDIHDDSIADGTARTLDLGELLRDRETPDEGEPAVVKLEDTETYEEESDREEDIENQVHSGLPLHLKLIHQIKTVNKILLVASIILIAASFGLVFLSNNTVADQPTTEGVTVLEIKDENLAEFLITGRLSRKIFYGVLRPSWDALPKEKQEKFLEKALEAGKEQGYSQVHLLTEKGKP
ncbi:MAG: hypothetical protein ABIV48_05365, partial [Pyrinomonadaceae bacterium]